MELSQYPVFKDWTVTSLLGQGASGTVYTVERRNAGYLEKAALKVMTFDKNSDEFSGISDNEFEAYVRTVTQEVVKEVQLVSQLAVDCSNIRRYRDFQVQRCQGGSKVEVMILMDLLSPLKELFWKEDISERAIIRLGIDICSALICLEKNSFLHRDIKPDNIFIDDTGNYILGDFDAAVSQNNKDVTLKGTINYMAPEVYFDGIYTPGADIYGIGMVLYRFLNGGALPFLNGRKPVTARAREEAMSRRLSGEIPVLEIENKILADCVIKAIQPDVDKRYSSAGDFKRDLEQAYNSSRNVRYIQDNFGQSQTKDKPVNLIVERRAPLTFADFDGLSDAELSSILETTVVILGDRADRGNPSARKRLIYINQMVKIHLTTSIEEYAEMILHACRLLVENSSFSSKNLENEMNDYIRDILEAKGNFVQDQTRQGRSSSGKSAGEVDIKVTWHDNEPALIEGLKLNAVSDSELNDHIQRLMVNYDPLGVYCHFLLIYYCGTSLNEFAGKLISWLNSCRISQISFDGIVSKSHYTYLSEVRVACRRDTRKEELVIFIMKMNK